MARRSRLALAALILASLSVGPSSAWSQQVTSGTKEFLRIYDRAAAAKDQAVLNLYHTYLNGVVQGIGFTHAAAEERGVSLYCAPGQLAINAQNGIQMIRSYIKKFPKNDEFPVSVVLLRAMTDTFPCR